MLIQPWFEDFSVWHPEGGSKTGRFVLAGREGIGQYVRYIRQGLDPAEQGNIRDCIGDGE